MKEAIFYKRILNSMRDMVLVKGPESRLLWANEAFLNYYGMTETELEGLIDGPQSDPDDTLQYVRDDKFVFDNEVDLIIPSEPVANSNGEVNYFQTIKSPVFENKKMIQTVGIARRLEDKKIQVQEMAELDAKVFTAPLRSIIDTLPIGTILLDHDLRIIKCNKEWCQLFGNGPELLNEKLGDHYKELRALTNSARKSLETKEEVGEVVQLEVGNSTCFFDFKINTWSYPNGLIGGLIIVATDITSIKINEAKLELSNKKLSLLNDELSQFAYRTSHDLRAPLATIKGLTDFIEEDLDNGDIDEVKLNIKQVFKHASKLDTLVVDILNLAKSDLKQQDYSRVKLFDVCEDIRDSYADLLIEKKVDFNFRFDSSLVFWSQGTRLRQIIGNLVANSIKYSDSSKQERFVDVSCSIGSDVTLIVSDNGVGVDSINEEKLFDMFSRFNVDLAEGSGLGMSIVKKNVEALEGKITVNSSKLGTQFSINLPITNRK